METIESLVLACTNYKFSFCRDYILPGLSWSNDADGLVYSSNSRASNSCVPEAFAFNNFYYLNFILYSTKISHDLLSPMSIISSLKKVMNLLFLVMLIILPYKLYFSINVHFRLLTNLIDFFDFRNVDYNNILHFLKVINWPKTIQKLDVNSATYCLYDTIHSSILQFDPEVSYNQSKFPS